jgi:ABC-2 type transport system ATP-binding protein
MGDSSEALIVTRSLFKTFGDVKALNGLNLEVKKGISGFIGPNGAGKTTTINILLGLVKPDHGEAHAFGMDCWKQSFEIRKRLGILHEKAEFPNYFSGSRYLEHVAHLYAITKPRQTATKLLKDVGLAQAADRTIKTYSAGMIQRLGLAQALIGNPELAILDEPTANLDPLGRMDFLEKIQTLYKDKHTNFLISTHILPELEKVCNWVSIINGGTIVDQGNIQDLVAKYSANTYIIKVSQPALLIKELEKASSVEKTWTDGQTIYAKTKNYEDLNRDILKLALELNVTLQSIEPVHGRLEDLFKTALEKK